MLRLGDEGTYAALGQPHVRPMDFTGRPMSTMVFVEPGGTDIDEALADWVTRALAYIDTLPPRTAHND